MLSGKWLDESGISNSFFLFITIISLSRTQTEQERCHLTPHMQQTLSGNDEAAEQILSGPQLNFWTCRLTSPPLTSAHTHTDNTALHYHLNTHLTGMHMCIM
ncbi:hypothetical protein ILYODFUR_002115 [Ilyodon furcidens]|uniref:Uncharacterized protein n=1 Tax=Ilyodon furcidens TaxID=33524 RepID=A0ABV0SW58_9TELE